MWSGVGSGGGFGDDWAEAVEVAEVEEGWAVDILGERDWRVGR